MRQEVVLQTAKFDPRLQTYWMVGSQIGLFFTFIGIPFMPIWWFFGRAIYEKSFEAMEFELTERSLNIRKGFIFRVEKSIPLDKIQDVGMREGPLLRKFGLSSLAVETAGQSNPQGAADAALMGVIDAPKFRDAILEQRDRVVSSAHDVSPLSTSAPSATPEDDVLVAIRDSLHRIENLLAK